MRNLFSPKKKEPDNIPEEKQDSNRKNIYQDDSRKAWRPLPSPRRQQQSLWPWVFTWMILFVLLFKLFQPSTLPPTATPMPTASATQLANPNIRIDAPDSVFAKASIQAKVEVENIDPGTIRVRFQNPDGSLTQAKQSVSGNTITVEFAVGEVPGRGAIEVIDNTDQVLATRPIMVSPSPLIEVSIKPTLPIDTEVFIAGYGIDLKVSLKDGANQQPMVDQKLKITSLVFDEKSVTTDSNGEVLLNIPTLNATTETEVVVNVTLLDAADRPVFEHLQRFPLVSPQNERVISNTNTHLYIIKTKDQTETGLRPVIGHLDGYIVTRLVPSPNYPEYIWVILTGWVKKEICNPQMGVCEKLVLQKKDGKSQPDVLYFEKGGSDTYTNIFDAGDNLPVIFVQSSPDNRFSNVQIIGLIKANSLP